VNELEMSLKSFLDKLKIKRLIKMSNFMRSTRFTSQTVHPLIDVISYKYPNIIPIINKQTKDYIEIYLLLKDQNSPNLLCIISIFF